MPVLARRDPAELPWRDLGVELVLECTGAFRREEDLKKHLAAGARLVILSAPARTETVATVVHGVNRAPAGEQVISCASCTTNCITPVAEVLDRRFGMRQAIMTTVHAYTSSQQLIDGPSKDFRRGRAGAANMLPASTGAALATIKALPGLAGQFDGVAIRVPIPVGSIADVVAVTARPVTREEVNDAFREEAASDRYRGILGVAEDPLVSVGHHRRPAGLGSGRGDDQGGGRDPGQGHELVRQRVGVHLPDDPGGVRRPRPAGARAQPGPRREGQGDHDDPGGHGHPGHPGAGDREPAAGQPDQRRPRGRCGRRGRGPGQRVRPARPRAGRRRAR